MSEPAIALRDVFCVHRTREGDAAALQGLDLSVARGEQVCILGPSGAGKSTLLRVIAGLQGPSAGRVHVLGVDAGRLRPRQLARLRQLWMGFLDQRAESTLAPELSIGEAVALPLALRGAARRERRARAAALLDSAGLGSRAGALPGELSGGERQRAALCAALVHRPALLLADEPTAELDERSAGAVVSLIRELSAIDGTTVVMVTHDAALAARSPRVVRIRDGRIVEDGSAGHHGLVIGRGGWIRLPEQLLRDGGIGSLARASAVPGGVLVSAAAPDTGASRAGPGSPAGAENTRRSTPARVELRAVSRSRGRGAARRVVLDRLTVTFEPGGLTAVTGRSGSGKTTLLEILAGLALPDTGELVLDGRSLSGAGVEARAGIRRQRVGYLPQEPAPIAFLSALENVTLALRVRGRSETQAVATAISVLEATGLPEVAQGQRVHRLSAGEAQRVALARAVACANGLLLVDEPTSRLDESGAREVARLLATAASESGHTVICATHDAEIVQRADHVLELGGSTDASPQVRHAGRV